jgi:hypothetical protein
VVRAGKAWACDYVRVTAISRTDECKTPTTALYTPPTADEANVHSWILARISESRKRWYSCERMRQHRFLCYEEAEGKDRLATPKVNRKTTGEGSVGRNV